jgi:hypothetical protein
MIGPGQKPTGNPTGQPPPLRKNAESFCTRKRSGKLALAQAAPEPTQGGG